MLGADDVHTWFQQGALTHPFKNFGGRDQESSADDESVVVSSIDLYRYMAAVAGSISPDDTPQSSILEELVGHADHFVFVLVDGLGLDQLADLGGEGLVGKTPTAEIRSVFPSTTAAALTSLATGVWPSEHGVVGWWTYFTESDRIICPLTFKERGTKRSAKRYGITPGSLIPSPPLYASFFRDCRFYLPIFVRGGAFAEWSRGASRGYSYLTPATAARRIAAHIKSAKGATYSYWYMPHLDSAGHKHGPHARKSQKTLGQIINAVSLLKGKAPKGTTIVLTADHGQVEVPPEGVYSFDTREKPFSFLRVAPTGEESTPIFHVQAGRRDEFRRMFADLPVSSAFALLTPEECADLELFGPGELSRRMLPHLGDYVGIAKEPALLRHGDGSGGKPDRGAHGGLRPAEMQIPLFVLRA